MKSSKIKTRQGKAIYYLCQIAIEQISFWISYLLVIFYFHDSDVGVAAYLKYSVLLFAVSSAFQIVSFKKPRFSQKIDLKSEFELCVKRIFFYCLALLVFAWFIKDVSLSRGFLVCFSVSTPFIVFLFGLFWNLIEKYFWEKFEFCERVIIYGFEEDVLNTIRAINFKTHNHYYVIGCISDNWTSAPGSEICRIGGFDKLEELLLMHRPDCLIVAVSNHAVIVDHAIAKTCDLCGVRLYVYNESFCKMINSFGNVRVGDANLISMRDEPMRQPINRVIKRLFDIAVSLPVVIILMPPLTFLVWIAQALQSPGNIFFVQDRSGLKGNVFRIIKFRTMHSRFCAKTQQAIRGDMRVYGIGKFLRRTSIDEIPQFINVLKGDMSVVGPRPHLPAHDKQWSTVCEKYNVRFFAKPGITGLAQVRGFRGEVTSENCILERIRCDLEYIENWSLSADVYIVFRTILVILFPVGNAY